MDSFKPHTSVPSLQLKAKVLRNEEVQDLAYVLTLIGAKEPQNKLLVEASVEPPENTHGKSTFLINIRRATDYSSACVFNVCLFVVLHGSAHLDAIAQRLQHTV